MTFLTNIIKTIFLGIIQGITEWLPISSTGHLLIFNSLWPIEPSEFFEVFKVVIQFGSILAVCVLYKNTLNPFQKNITANKKKRTLQLWSKVIVGVLPAFVFGLLLDSIVEKYLSANFIIAVALITYGLIFILVENHPRKEKIHSIEKLDYVSALKIGFFQCLALIPGTSRSGATILGGLYCGCSRVVASEFSFFVAIPVMVGASALKIVKYLIRVGLFSFSQLVLLVLGTAVAYFVSLIAIKTLLNYVRNHDFKIFGYYRIILGIFVILFFYVL